MSTRKKLFAKMNTRPLPNDIYYTDVKALLEYCGFVEISNKGDHVSFYNAKYNQCVRLDANGKRSLKPCYVKQVVNIIQSVLDLGGQEL